MPDAPQGGPKIVRDRLQVPESKVSHTVLGGQRPLKDEIGREDHRLDGLTRHAPIPVTRPYPLVGGGGGAPGTLAPPLYKPARFIRLPMINKVLFLRPRLQGYQGIRLRGALPGTPEAPLQAP